MKNKIIYSFLLVFVVALFSSAKKINGTCDKTSSCNQVIKSKETKEVKSEVADETERSFPSVGVFLINI